ncbi:hypothetical protein BDZ91DRAFT_731575 [Kalaharituber pfeilii]|nr:hypothetical protein BDZ91DRAFT_731575 [Kalaharituber pfeilii]
MKLRYYFSVVVAAATSFGSTVSANTPLSDSFITTDLANNAGFEIAFASRPLWHFGKSMGNKPCYPNHCFNSAGRQHGVKPTKWPNAASGCPDPGPDGCGNPFPTYYTVTRCSDTELRVVYNLYFQKDGWSNVVLAKGHMHDWERIIVLWRRDSDGMWRRKELFRSYHSGYMLEDWANVQNTFDYSNISEQGGKDKDGAKIYVAWGKHAMFSTRNSGWNDPFSQGCERAFRSADWWYLPARDDLLYAGRSSNLGKRINAANWGSATSNPVVVEQRVCSEVEGGYWTCRLADGEELVLGDLEIVERRV